MSAKALYPGTFDPPTNGHVDLIQRGAKLFEHLTVAILNNPVKNPLFTVDERVEMLKESTRQLDNVSVATFEGLMVDFARQNGATAVLRGIRAITELPHALQVRIAPLATTAGRMARYPIVHRTHKITLPDARIYACFALSNRFDARPYPR